METRTLFTVGVELPFDVIEKGLIETAGVERVDPMFQEVDAPYILITNDGVRRSAFLSWRTLNGDVILAEEMARLTEIEDPTTVLLPPAYDSAVRQVGGLGERSQYGL